MKLGKKKNSARSDNHSDCADLRAKIESRAYALWLADGCQHGNDMNHWLQAEREVQDNRSAPVPHD